MPKPDPELQLDQFIGKFSKDMGTRIRAARSKMRTAMPQALELVYDNYNFFVIGYGPNEKAGDAVFSLAAQAKGLSLCFLQGAKLSDPHKLLRGSGSVVRNISLASADTLDDPKVRQLMDVALKRAKSPFPADGSHRLIIKSVSARQRPRQVQVKKTKPSRRGQKS
jgi:hypothetical protein